MIGRVFTCSCLTWVELLLFLCLRGGHFYYCHTYAGAHIYLVLDWAWFYLCYVRVGVCIDSYWDLIVLELILIIFNAFWYYSWDWYYYSYSWSYSLHYTWNWLHWEILFTIEKSGWFKFKFESSDVLMRVDLLYGHHKSPTGPILDLRLEKCISVGIPWHSITLHCIASLTFDWCGDCDVYILYLLWTWITETIFCVQGDISFLVSFILYSCLLKLDRPMMSTEHKRIILLFCLYPFNAGPGTSGPLDSWSCIWRYSKLISTSLSIFKCLWNLYIL